MVLLKVAAQVLDLDAWVTLYPMLLSSSRQTVAPMKSSNYGYFKHMYFMNASPQSLLVMVLTTPLLAIVDFRSQALHCSQLSCKRGFINSFPSFEVLIVWPPWTGEVQGLN